MHISAAGLDLIRTHEGCVLVAYPDPGTGGHPWTIGYGHTLGVRRGDVCSFQQAEKWLMEDVDLVEQCIERSVTATLTQGQFDALCSFVFNVGCPAFQSSRLLNFLNTGEPERAAAEFGKWVHSGQTILPGLVRRRRDEWALFTGEDD